MNAMKSICRTGLRLVLALTALPTSATAQDQRGPETVAFEVVSIKPVTGPLQPSGPQTPGRYRNQDATLRTLVAFAYELPFTRIAGGPAWFAERRFAIDAVAPGTPSLSQVRQMVRTLLAERFNLKAHTESREMDVFLLERSRLDSKPESGLKVSNERDCSAAPAAAGRGDVDVPCGLISVGAGEIRGRSVNMAQLVRNLTAIPMLTGIERVVLDRTNLQGLFDFVVMFRPPSDQFIPPPHLDLYPELPTAFQEQLGLKLTPSRAPVDVLVIDHADSPSDN